MLFHTNKSQDYSTVITGQLSKRFGSNLEFNAAYTWSEMRDVITLGSSTASSNFLNTVVNGTLANRRLATSALQVPHSIMVGGTADIPLGFYLSMQYNGRAGRPYSYITKGTPMLTVRPATTRSTSRATPATSPSRTPPTSTGSTTGSPARSAWRISAAS